MKRTLKRFLSMALCMVMLMGTFPTAAMASDIDNPLTGETGSGWSEVDTPPEASGEESLPEVPAPETEEDDKLPAEQPEEKQTPSDTEGEQPAPPLDSGPPTEPSEEVKPKILPECLSQVDGWLQEYQKVMQTWPKYDPRARAASNVPSTADITWVGTRITFANTAYIGSPIPKIYFNGDIAFCGEWNGHSSLPVTSLKSEYAKLAVEQKR